MLTVTGNYAAFDARFLPPYVFTDSDDALAQRWIEEARNGIEDTGIRPGLIKLGFNGGPFTRPEQKLIRAAAGAPHPTDPALGGHSRPGMGAVETRSLMA